MTKYLRKLSLIIALLVALSALSGCEAPTGYADGDNSNITSSGTASNSQVVLTSAGDVDVEFSARDIDVGYDEGAASSIVLEGSSAKITGDGLSVAEGIITISAEGTYIVSGTLTNGQLVVNASDTDKVQIVLNNASIHNESSAAIYIKNADKVFITLAEGSENSLTDGAVYTASADDESTVDGVIFSKADLTINGSGSLDVTGSYKHGIVSKDDLVITDGKISVTAVGQGLYGKDCVKIKDGSFELDTGGDAVQSDNTEDATRGFIYVEGGSFTVNAGTDGLQAETLLWINGGEFNIVTGGGSVNASTDDKGNAKEDWGHWGGGNMQRPEKPATPPDVAATPDTAPIAMPTAAVSGVEPITDTTAETTTESTSAKALKAGGTILISGGTFNIDSSDDSLHSNGDLTLSGGEFTIASGDDGLHADSELTLTDGTVKITKSYEGIEGNSITIEGGSYDITSSDDGLNSAGGNDASATSGRPGQGSFNTDSDSFIRISGGEVTINASGDGIDSNGALYIEGGASYVDGPTNTGNSALDYDGTGIITGGIIIAVGAAQMAQGFSDSSTQYSILHNLSTAANSGDEVKLTNSEGVAIASYIPKKNYQSVIISAPELANGEYTLTAGSQSATLTLTSVITSNGGGSMGGGMGGGKGGGGRGEIPPETDSSAKLQS